MGKDGFEPPNSEEDRFTVCCRWPLGYLPILLQIYWFLVQILSKLKPAIKKSLEPLVGVEPTTCWLQISCSTNWAKVAINFYCHQNLLKRSAVKNFPLLHTYLPCFFGKAKVGENVKYKNFEKEIFKVIKTLVGKWINWCEFFIWKPILM